LLHNIGCLLTQGKRKKKECIRTIDGSKSSVKFLFSIQLFQEKENFCFVIAAIQGKL